MFSKTLLEHLLDVISGSSLFFLCDLSLVSVAVIHRLTWGRAEFGTRRILILFQERRSFGFKLCFRIVVISSRKINYFTLIKILSKFGSMLNLFPLSEMLCLQLGILFKDYCSGESFSQLVDGLLRVIIKAGVSKAVRRLARWLFSWGCSFSSVKTPG